MPNFHSAEVRRHGTIRQKYLLFQTALGPTRPQILTGVAAERILIQKLSVDQGIFVDSLWNEQTVNGWPPYGYRRLYKPPSARSLGIILQETADLMRPSYPLYIRKRAFKVFDTTTRIPDGSRAEDCIQIILGWLGESGEEDVSPGIMSALYRNLLSAPLHLHYDEVLSNFIVILARYLSSWARDYHSLPYARTYIVRDLCHLRQLSFKELNAIHDYLESWLQQQSNSRWSYNRDAYFIALQMEASILCSRQDARFHILCEALLDIALDTTIGATSRHRGLDWFLKGKGAAVNRFFKDNVLLIDHTEKIKRIASFIAFYLRHVVHALLSTDILTPSSHIPIQPRRGLTFSCLASTIKTITSLIAASPDPAFSCREIQAENVVNAFVDFFSNFDLLDFRGHPDDFGDYSRLKSDSHSLLLLIANPFVGLSALSNSHCISILEDNGWVGNAPSSTD
ncbi:hypothetical protein BU17DRAFT_93087 [Hysterangium stoloniferum]|nr:hypothetical protein BU17DRAFT_93087 [Hysterangium stoloniferum]